MNGNTEKFWKVYDRDMERLNSWYIKMALADDMKQFDTAMSQYMKYLERLAERTLSLYDTMTGIGLERKDKE